MPRLREPEVYHDPKIAFVVALQFYEVVAAAEGAYLFAGGINLACHDGCGGINVKSLWHILFGLRGLVPVASERYLFAYTAEYAFAQYLRRQFIHSYACLYDAHAATYVDTYGIGYHCVLGGEYSSDGHAFASVGVGHQGYVVKHKGSRQRLYTS